MTGVASGGERRRAAAGRRQYSRLRGLGGRSGPATPPEGLSAMAAAIGAAAKAIQGECSGEAGCCGSGAH